MDFQTRYEFDPKTDLLGKGGFSKVYKANDTLLERTVALKFFTANVADKYQILNEIKKVIRFEHPNLCKYYDVAVLSGKNILGEAERIEVGIMEYIDAGNIKTYIKKYPEYIDKLLIDVLKGLAYLHKHGIAHRDLKPQNILIKIVDDEPVSKITDFGISKLIDSDDNNSSALLGTIEYMAPEQFNPKKYGLSGRITTNLDLWSFGLLVYEALCHKPFFGSRSTGTSAEQVMSNILSDASISKVDTLPPKYREIIKRCLVKNASERVQNALELISLFDHKVTSFDKVQTDKVNVTGTQLIEPMPEETQVMERVPEEVSEETQVIEPKPEIATDETLVIEPDLESGMVETQVIESLPEETQVMERVPEAASEETQILNDTVWKPVINDAINVQLNSNGEDSNGDEIKKEKPQTRPIRKAVLLSSIAILLIIFFIAYAFLNPLRHTTINDSSAANTPPVNIPSSGYKPDNLNNFPELIPVNGGTFFMGDNNDLYPDNPAHEVALSDFYIGRYEVTVDQFKQFIDETKYVTTAEKVGSSNVYKYNERKKKWEWVIVNNITWRHDVHGNLLDPNTKGIPVVHVSWKDANEYCKWLSIKKNETYRLPTEAEWEFAAKGGNHSEYYGFSGSNNLDEVAWFIGNSDGTIHPVGQKKANGLKIYDMSGNVSEWCNDWYDKNYYKNAPQKNPLGPGSGKQRVLRGGAWGTVYKEYCNNSCRYKENPDEHGGNIGFRICKSEK